MGDLIFAFIHLFALIAILGYAFISLLQGNSTRFAIILAGITAYYFLVLHKAVLKEIKRRKNLRE